MNRERIQYVVGFLLGRSAANSGADSLYKVEVTTGILQQRMFHDSPYSRA